jgi:hypothetical protein
VNHDATSTSQPTERLVVADTRPRGQVLVLFALLLTFLLASAAFVVDLAWIWVNELKVQRAADAAALAGVIYLPGNPSGAATSSHDESRKNGYTDGDGNFAAAPNGGVDVYARPDPGDPRRMMVTVSSPIETFFMQIFGFDQVQVSRDAKAEFILPVPMGSPESYYGVFGQIRTPDGGVWQPTTAASIGPRTSTGVVTSGSGTTLTQPTASSQNNSASCSSAAALQWGQTPAGTPATLDDRVAAGDDLPSGQWIKSATANNRICLGNLGFNIPADPVTPPGAPAYPGTAILGIEVRLKAFATDTTGCTINTDLMWGAAASGGLTAQGGAAGNTQGAAGDRTVSLDGGNEGTAPNYRVLGGAADTWGRTWSVGQIESNDFRVRIWNNDPLACSVLSAGQPFNSPTNPPPAPTGAVAGEVYIDRVEVVVHYQMYTWVPDPMVVSPYNDTLNPRGLWGTFINQGAEKINGDAYLPKWNPRTNPQNPEYNPQQYYNYAIEMPAGATEGEVWIFDAPFCATNGSGQYGTGDRYFGGSNSATSAYYTLYNTFNTPFDFGDDVTGGPVSTAHTIFQNTTQVWSDPSLNGPTPSGYTSCQQGATSSLSSGRFWHNRWYPMQPAGVGETPASAEQPHPLISGGPTGGNAPRLAMTGGNTYRLHTRSTNPSSPNEMDNANGHNSFSVWTRAWCGASVCADAPRVYGLGAMEAFTPLQGGGSAQFYLAEIEPVHEGKSLEIRLWDPGDTGALSADLRVLYPTGGVYNNADLDFAASAQASGATNCNGRTDDTVGPPGPLDPFITTNTGGSSQYNGCWLTIVIVIPNGYDGDAPGTLDDNWWKIQYDMGGSAAENAFDLTTWQVTLRGNPVHLVVP